MRIRDPIHGTIQASDDEAQVLDNRYFQRLRHVRQLGFGELAFPGATHTRHAHSLGAMHMATRLFDGLLPKLGLTAVDAARFRQTVRLAALCHDLGHLPLSHSSELAAPLRATLKLPAWLGPNPEGTQATHEDYTAKILLDSSLSRVIAERFGPEGVAPEQVTALVVGAEPPAGARAFVSGGRDFGPLLRQLVSGELDGDRMDYLLRDSFYTGVQYGHYDADWIAQNLVPAERDAKIYLALSKAAIFAFEDFLLSRYHMFLSVYFHHTSVSFDHMLRRFYTESPGEFVIPSDVESFMLCDDVALAMALRQSKNPWAQRIVARRGFKLLLQVTELDRGYDLKALVEALRKAGVGHLATESVGVLSKYQLGGGPPLYVFDAVSERLIPVAEYTPLYQRYAGALKISRVYCDPGQVERARELLSSAFTQR